ncbi:MAG TPA: hypothetical protein VEB86_11385 [Chryseosolibacter sp.]|nr:hypothetical protein [Chryseosolibacter sp.]
MLRNLCFLTLTVLTLASCGGKNSSTEQSVGDSTATADLSGEYSTGDKTATLSVTNWSESGFRFELTVVTQDALCTGELNGTTTFDPQNKQWIYDDESTGCLLKFHWVKDAFEVEEEGACDHGAACSFAGTYQRGAPGQALTEDDQVVTPQALNSLMDHYLALPDEYLTCEVPGGYDENERKAAIKTQSDSHMVVDTEELAGMQLAMFEGAGKFIALVYECGAGCQCTKRHVLQYDNGQWVDRYADLVPGLDGLAGGEDVAVALRIPDGATTIEVYNFDDPGQVLGTLKWDGSRFNLSQ